MYFLDILLSRWDRDSCTFKKHPKILICSWGEAALTQAVGPWVQFAWEGCPVWACALWLAHGAEHWQLWGMLLGALGCREGGLLEENRSWGGAGTWSYIYACRGRKYLGWIGVKGAQNLGPKKVGVKNCHSCVPNCKPASHHLGWLSQKILIQEVKFMLTLHETKCSNPGFSKLFL